MAAVLFNFHCVVVVAQTIKGTEENLLGVEQGVEHRKRKTNKEQNFCYKTDENNPQSIDSEQVGKTNIYSASLPSLCLVFGSDITLINVFLEFSIFSFCVLLYLGIFFIFLLFSYFL